MQSRSATVFGLWPIYSAYFISQLGNWAFRASVLYDIYNTQGGSSNFLGDTIILIYGSILIGSRFLAPYADKFSSKRILVALDCMRSLLLLPLLFWTDLHQIGVVILTLSIVTVLSVSSPLFTAAQMVYIRRTLEKDRITSAIAVIANIDWLTYLLGNVAGSLLLLKVDFHGIVIIDLVTFVLSMILLSCFLKTDKQGSHVAISTVSNEEARAQGRSIYYVLLAIFLLNLGAGVNNLYPNVVARDIYHTGQIGLSSLYLGNGIGGFFGALCVYKVRRLLNPIRLLIVSSLCIAASLIGMSIFAGMLISVVSGSLMLFFGQIFGIIASSYVLTSYPAKQAGKASGLFTAATFAGVAANSLVFTVAQPTYTLQTFLLFLLFCVVSVCFSLFLLLLYERNLKKLHKKEETFSLVEKGAL